MPVHFRLTQFARENPKRIHDGCVSMLRLAQRSVVRDGGTHLWLREELEKQCDYRSDRY